MLFIVATLLIMLATAWAQYRNGIFSSFAMLFMVIASGLVAFNFFEPIADALEPAFQQNALAGCEDFLSLILLFSLTLFLLRVAANYLSPELIEQNGNVQFLGAGAVGFVTGYFVAGFLLCATQTLPLDERFLDYEPRVAGESPFRRIIPADRAWIGMMQHAGAVPLSGKEDADAETPEDRFMTFDRFATFELRYTRYRRAAMKYRGEFDVELGKQRAK